MNTILFILTWGVSGLVGLGFLLSIASINKDFGEFIKMEFSFITLTLLSFFGPIFTLSVIAFLCSSYKTFVKN